METVALLLLSILPCLVIAAGLYDLTTMTIPNWISGALIVGFFPAALAVGMPPMTVALHVGMAVAALVCGMLMFALRWLGGGDAKLMAAAMLWLGLTGSLMFMLYTAVAGGLFCLILMGLRANIGPFLFGAPAWATRLLEPKGDIPYGVAIAAGALLAFPSSGLIAVFASGV
jgi:prepilin peptidase CpaA